MRRCPTRARSSSLGRPTSAIADSDEWLAFVERFGIVSDRIVLLEAMTVAQNLAISFDLESRAGAAGDHDARRERSPPKWASTPPALDTRVADAAPLLRSQIYLARALALDPAILVLEHPTANLSPDEAKAFAAIVSRVSERRGLTTIGLLMDEKFAKATGGRLLIMAAGHRRRCARVVALR